MRVFYVVHNDVKLGKIVICGDLCMGHTMIKCAKKSRIIVPLLIWYIFVYNNLLTIFASSKEAYGSKFGFPLECSRPLNSPMNA